MRIVLGKDVKLGDTIIHSGLKLSVNGMFIGSGHHKNFGRVLRITGFYFNLHEERLDTQVYLHDEEPVILVENEC